MAPLDRQDDPAQPDVAATPDPEQITIYEATGAMPFFHDLVAGFYRRVAEDPVLRRLYPEQEDLGPAAERLELFLAQYWGGPTTYSEQRGHPRLRMRHLPFTIGPEERDHWLAAMNGSLDELQVHPLLRERFDAYFTMSAEAMRNHD